VHVIQGKVQKKIILSVMISLSIHAVTSQDDICAQCVTNGLQGKIL